MAYHIDDNGKSAICTAKPGNCPKGGQHFETKALADKFVQERDEKEFGLINTSLDPHQKFVRGMRDDVVDDIRHLKRDIRDIKDYINNIGKENRESELAHADMLERIEILDTQERRLEQLDYEIENFGKTTESLLDSRDFGIGDYDEVIFKIDNIIRRETVQPKGEVVGYVLHASRSSNYGSIGGNAKKGYSLLTSPELAEGLVSFGNPDSFSVNSEGGNFVVKYVDHDGHNTCTIKPITKENKAELSERLEDSSIERRLEYIEEMDSIKMK